VTNYRKTGIKKRTMQFGSTTETDFVCMACNSIVPDGKHCGHCTKKKVTKDARLKAFLAARKTVQP
jgi:hypothetical protein